MSPLLLSLDALLLEPNWLNETRREFRVEKLRTPLQILHLSDLQLRGEEGYRERNILGNLSKWQVDVICVTGDVFETERGMEAGIRFLKALSLRAPVFLVLGNWEHWANADLEAYRREISSSGIRLLVNESVPFRWKGEMVVVAGVDDPATGHDDLAAACKGVDMSRPVLLLSHAPVILPKAAGKADFVLAGHTHGGQVSLPVLGPPWMPPGCRPYIYGAYESRGTQMYVTSGVGTSMLPIRLLCRPEIALITLTGERPNEQDRSSGR